jgi:hypothetical protein
MQKKGIKSEKNRYASEKYENLPRGRLDHMEKL